LFSFDFVRPPLLCRCRSVCPLSSSTTAWSYSALVDFPRHVFVLFSGPTLLAAWSSPPLVDTCSPAAVVSDCSPRGLHRCWSTRARLPPPSVTVRKVVFAAAGRRRDACCCRPPSGHVVATQRRPSTGTMSQGLVSR